VASAGALPGTSVILVDADLRKPNLHELFDWPNLLGLTDVLAAPEAAAEAMLQKALKPTAIGKLRLLPAGRTPLDPGALLNSARFVKVLEFLKAQADLIILDSAPLLEIVETRAVANAVDATVLVLSDGQSRNKEVKRAIEYFKNRRESSLLGLVFNRVRPPRSYEYYSTYQQASLAAQTAGASNTNTAWWNKLWPFGGQAQTEAANLTLVEVAEQLGVSTDTARRWCEEGRIPAHRKKRRWIVELEDMNRFVAAYQRGELDGAMPDVADTNQPVSNGGTATKNGHPDISGRPETKRLPQQN
jgi:capsular exopolysaccharide synthesis family protein